MKINLSVDEIVNQLRSQSSYSDKINSYKNTYLTLNEQCDPRKLFLYIKPRHEVEKLNRHFVSIFNIFGKLTHFIVYKDPSLLQKIFKTGIDIDALKRRNPKTFLSYGRIDTILANQFKLVEFNCRRPQMFEDADWFSLSIKNTISADVTEETNSLHIAQTLRNHYILNRSNEPENILLLSSNSKIDSEFSLYNNLLQEFPKSNLIDEKDFNKVYKNLSLKDNDLFFNNQKIDLIIPQHLGKGSTSFYFSSGAIRNPLIAKSYSAGRVEIFTSPASIIAGTKMSLALLEDQNFLEKLDLSSDEKSALEFIPKSIEGNCFDFSKGKNEYVIKLSGRGGGSGIILGENLNNDEWGACKKFQNENRHFIVQEKLNFTLDDIYNLQTRKVEKAYITLEPIIVNGAGVSDEPFVSGYATRAIPQNLYQEGMKFNPAYDRDEILFGALVESK